MTLTVSGTQTLQQQVTTDADGTALFTLTGTLTGTDTLVALATIGTGPLESNRASVTWGSPSEPIATTTILGRFYHSNGSGEFTARPTDEPAFVQLFPTINFNPPLGTIPGSTVTFNDRPMVNVTTDLHGTYSGSIVAEGNGLRAGVGELYNFNAVFTGEFVVAQAGNITFNFYSDDGFIFGVGNGARRVSGAARNPPAGGLPPFTFLPWMGDYNGITAPVANQVTVHFPAPGRYPYEVDYSECCAGELVLTMTTAQSAGNRGIPPSGALTLSPTTLVARPTGQSQTLVVQATDATGTALAFLPVSVLINGANPQQTTRPPTRSAALR